MGIDVYLQLNDEQETRVLTDKRNKFIYDLFSTSSSRAYIESIDSMNILGKFGYLHEDYSLENVNHRPFFIDNTNLAEIIKLLMIFLMQLNFYSKNLGKVMIKYVLLVLTSSKPDCLLP